MKKPHILIVEDDAEMREALSDILSEEGYEVKTTGKGKEALAIAIEEKEKFPFAICLIDLKLPDIDGIKVLEEIKHINPGTYAILMTAFASKDTAIEALKVGAYSYIEKPVNMDELLHVIKRATESYQLQEEKKQAEDKIRELAEIYTDLRERAPVAIVNVYEDYHINCTDRLLEWTGWSREEIKNINLVKESRFTNDSGKEVVLPPLACKETLEKTEKEHIPKLMHGETLEGVYQCYNKKDGGKVDLELNSIGYFGGKEPKPENFEYTICIFSNITERKRAEDMLRESEAKYMDLYENATDMISTFDLQGRFTSANRAACTTFGYRKDEVSKRTLSDLLLPEDAKLAWERLQKMVALKSDLIEEQPREYKAVRKDGSIFDVEVRTRLIMENGEIAGAQGISRDITERKRAEEELRESEEKYRTLYDSSRDAIMTLTPEEGFLSGNPATVEIFGCKDEKEFTSRTPHDLSPQYQPDGTLSSEKDKQMMAIAMEKGSHFFEWTHKRMDGHEFPATVLLTRMELQGRRMLQATVRDITERKRAKEKIWQAEKEWVDSFGSLADVMVVVDTNFTIERVNKAAEELVGKTKEEIIGMKCYKVFHNLDNPPKNCPLKKSLNTKKVETVERYEQKFGRYFSVKCSPVLDENGEIIKFVNLISDITERKRAEKEVKKYTKELERVNRDLEDFTSTVSHDLRAPLRSIQAFSMLLTEDYADVLDETGRGYLNRVKEAVERMSVQIEDLLTLSRVGRKFIEVETVDLNELLEEIKADLSARIGERGGEVVVGKLPSVFTQRVWMKELFTNLIDNGLKFNKSGKPRVEISCEGNGKNYLFKVKDNGIGIEEKHIDKIFSLFERLHSQSEYEGTGAGLAICMKIVEGLGGDIWVESKLGEGSTFCFTIPRN
jgi:PAS domain S-box-containing protein